MKLLLAAFIGFFATQAAMAADPALNNPLTDEGSWAELRGDIVGDIELQDGASVIDVTAPYRAHDAATVPIVIAKTDHDAPDITSALIVVDENPAPLAAEMTFGAAMDPLRLELRVRVDQYSNVRVIAQTPDGSFMNGRFVKASGGCSAPASKNPELALATLGQIRARHFDAALPRSGDRREAQIMIRHPNYSGMQRDQMTHLFIGAHFIHKLAVFQGDDMLFTLDGGISISENPVFRFDYTDNGVPTLRVRAEDTEGNVFEQVLDKIAPS